MKLMEEIDDLIEEAKLRTLWWAMLIFIVTYFLSHTSTSMWMNLPVAILLVSALRLLTYKVEFRMKVPSVLPQTYLSHMEKKQLSVNDSRLSYSPPPPKWKRKIDSPLVEAAMHEFIDKILKDFVTDLWYSDITPDREAPELINAIIMDALGEISGRVKEINLVDLLTRDMVDLIGDHIDLFRRNQAAIGVDVMKTLASDERDERLKHHLMVSGELHPALLSPESEYKVLQRLVSGILAVVLRSRDAQSPLVRCFAREFVTCLVFQPILRFANPVYINEVIGYILLAIKDADCDSFEAGMQVSSSSLEKFYTVNNQATDMMGTKVDDGGERDSNYHQNDQERIEPKPADWARMLEVATQRRTEILAPENLENWWAKGRNYRRKEEKIVNARAKKFASKGNIVTEPKMPEKEVWANKTAALVGEEQRIMMGLSPDQIPKDTHFPREFSKWSSFEGESIVQELHDANEPTSDVNKNRLKRSSSTSDLKVEPDSRRMFTADAGGPIISEFYSPDFGRHAEGYKDNSASKIILRNEGQHAPKLRCRVVGAYFEKIGSTSFAVYSIAVTDAENKTWFVKRRYRNFERLHRHLKEIPNYTLHLPPKRIFSSSTEDSFVHQRCIQLDKYLKDLLSIANVAEQHEVWDFFSVSSKNYSFGKSSSVMRTLAVNVDDAVDDIVRQFKGVSDGLMRKVVGSSSASSEASSSITGRNLSWAPDESSKSVPRQNCMETINSTSDNEEDNKQGSHGSTCAQIDGSLSDNELNLKSSEPELFQNFDVPTGKQRSGVKHEVIGSRIPPAKLLAASTRLEDLTWIPPEWTPSNVSVPLLNLVDKVFQLNRRGWLRRQVFWISKQIIQLVMEDAIDDFLLRQIYWLRKEDTIAQGIRWVQEMLWPGGNFFTTIGPIQGKPNDFQPDEMPSQHSGQFSGTTASTPGSFEQELEAARRASEIKKLLFDGAPAALVGLIGQKQYRRCASDIFYFTQSTTCVKQLAYAMLELVLVSIFPELQDLILDLHGKNLGCSGIGLVEGISMILLSMISSANWPVAP